MAGSRIAPATPETEPNGSFLNRAEVRDVLAWMRLLVDPRDAPALARALARPPIELRQVEMARVIQVARRRKLDLVLGLAAAVESPQVPLEARERVQRFLELHRSVSAGLDDAAPDALLAQLVELVGLRGAPLLACEDAAERRASMRRLQLIAQELLRREPTAGLGDLVAHLAALAPDPDAHPPAPAHDPAQELRAMLQLLREDLLEDVGRIGGRLGELRLDTDLDVSHGVVRYLELLKLAALLERPPSQSLADALADVNARLLAAATPLQREILETSTLDHTLLALDGEAGAGGPVRAQAMAPREQHSLRPFLPRRGAGLALSASDIHTYRSCPLRYKYARVLRIPVAHTVNQRFGIVVHQVLERYHRERGQTLAQMLGQLEACWRRAGFGKEGPRERELLEKARTALTRYHARLCAQDPQPVWFERQFDFRLGPHHVRGRVDRVDRVSVGSGVEYELIDYKTSRPKSAEQLREDVQLSLYALGAREDWQLETSRRAYHYVLDDLKVPVAHGAQDAESVRDVVLEVGEGILSQQFQPTPAPAACAICDYRIACPAAAA